MSPRLNRIIVGDIHGHARMLQALLDFHGVQNHYVFLGDYIDRGPDARSVIDLIRQLPSKTTLAGNHEQMMIKILKGPGKLYGKQQHAVEKQAWLSRANGGQETLKSFGLPTNATWADLPGVYQSFLTELKLWYEDEDVLCVHAGLADAATSIRNQDPDTILWTRAHWLDHLRPYRGKRVVFGHTISSSRPDLCNSQGLIYKNDCIGIDTSAWYCGVLTSLVIDQQQNWLVYQYHERQKRVLSLGPLTT
ncbi:MAG: serine/threonine protein phosphatase [Leptospiraceae bacterium]|nr:serine/threonine protein phosphatase [Leptospiraceae bacterium]